MYTPSYDIAEVSIPQIKVLTVSEFEPVDTLKAKDYIRENTDLPASDEQIVTDLITQCRAAIERYVNFSLKEKTIQVYWEKAYGDIDLPDGPHGAITNAKRIYSEEDPQDIVSGTDYFVSGLTFKKIRANRKLSTKYYHQDNGLQLDVEVGYAAADVPEDIRLALLKTVAYNYEYREAQGDSGVAIIPDSVKASLSSYRRDIWL